MIEVAPIVYDELVNIQNTYDGSLKEGSSLFLRKLCGLKDVAPEVASDLLWVPQGAAMAEAQDGVADLAAEIFEFIASSPDASSPWKVCICRQPHSFFSFLLYFIYGRDAVCNVVIAYVDTVCIDICMYV